MAWMLITSGAWEEVERWRGSALTSSLCCIVMPAMLGLCASSQTILTHCSIYRAFLRRVLEDAAPVAKLEGGRVFTCTSHARVLPTRASTRLIGSLRVFRDVQTCVLYGVLAIATGCHMLQANLPRALAGPVPKRAHPSPMTRRTRLSSVRPRSFRSPRHGHDSPY